MGIDIVAGGRNVNGKRRSAPASDNVYQKLLVKLYRFLSRRTDSKFNAIVLKRMFMSGNNRPPIGLARVARYMRGDAKKGKIAVVVGKVTDDARLINVPKLTVCALTFTEGARARILKAGGECLTFDQLALREPKGNNTVLLRGRLKARKSFRYFGMGEKGAHKRPRVRSQGRKFEKARGRRRSRGFKV